MLSVFNNIIPSIKYPQRSASVTAVPNNKYPNLAPLSYDTVSFGHSEKNMTDRTAGVNLTTAKQAYALADSTEKYLRKQLGEIFSDMVRTPDGADNETKPIETISYRTKKPLSIQEKSATRKWENLAEIKANMTDLVGARIIMADASRKNVDKVINRIAKAEANNQLKILEIENYRPDPIMDDDGNIVKSYDYSSPSALSNLKKECANNGKIIAKKDEDLPTGYMAIHLLTKLPNGLTGEIQILGTDVAQLKEIEDLCYKAKAGKSIDKKYAPVEEMLEPLKDSDDSILQKEYMDYTRDAYIYQRDKEPQMGKRKYKTKFLEIPEYLPKELDFNNLEKKMKECDLADKKPKSKE